MGFGGKMDYGVYLSIAKKSGDQSAVADIAFDKTVIGFMLYRLEIFQVAGVCKGIEINDTAIGVAGHEMVDEVGADKSRAAGDQHAMGSKGFRHGFSFPRMKYCSALKRTPMNQEGKPARAGGSREGVEQVKKITHAEAGRQLDFTGVRGGQAERFDPWAADREILVLRDRMRYFRLKGVISLLYLMS
jgi:hypothetical protein